MEKLLWIVLLAGAVGFVWLIWHKTRMLAERRRAEEARFALFMADHGVGGPKASLSPAAAAAVAAEAPGPGSIAAPPVPAADGLGQQKLLFDAAHKAGEANEPALAIQLYAKLLSRFPATAFSAAARAAVEAQKRKLSRHRA